MDAKTLTETIVKVIEDKNGRDTVVMELKQPAIADYFIVTTGKNYNHVRAIAEDVEEKLYEAGVAPTRSEGVREGRWAVIDYDSVIVHVFGADARDFYCLEKLWANGDKERASVTEEG